MKRLSDVCTTNSSLQADDLSAREVAASMGLSVSEFAKLLGRRRQPMSDEESDQTALAHFARIAGLRAVLSASELRAWLDMPNELLEGNSPTAVIREGGVETVAELAEDMLSGSPA
ncbi:MAG: hypothetical protein GY719_07295 [bacterium]|nr:hypothetical protein [bacterium]